MTHAGFYRNSHRNDHNNENDHRNSHRNARRNDRKDRTEDNIGDNLGDHFLSGAGGRGTCLMTFLVFIGAVVLVAVVATIAGSDISSWDSNVTALTVLGAMALIGVVVYYFRKRK